MSVNDAKVIDAIGVDKETGSVVLEISDHLEWNNEHLFLLQEKLNTYLAFVESGELLESYPDAENRDVWINIMCKFPLTEEAESFVEKVRGIVETVGINLKYKVLTR